MHRACFIGLFCLFREAQEAALIIGYELPQGRWRRVAALVRAPGALAFVSCRPSRRLMDGKALEKFWRGGRKGTLSPQMQALAWGMGEAGIEPVDIAAKITKVGGGNPSTASQPTPKVGTRGRDRRRRTAPHLCSPGPSGSRWQRRLRPAGGRRGLLEPTGRPDVLQRDRFKPYK